jgi:hypothetical protein
MNWDALGAIEDLIGGIAVIGSLVYVCLQVRQSNEISKSELSTCKKFVIFFRDGVARKTLSRHALTLMTPSGR